MILIIKTKKKLTNICVKETLDSVLKEELRLLDILMADKNLTGRTKKLLIKEYWKRLNNLYRMKEAEFKAGILPLNDLQSYQKSQRAQHLCTSLLDQQRISGSRGFHRLYV